MKSLLMLSGLVLGCVTILASAAPVTLTSTFTVDDSYDFYLSTDDSVLGNWIGSGDDWCNAQSFSIDLIPGVTNYIHIAARDDWGVIAGLMGEFTLSDGQYAFANGTQRLVTNAGDWQVSATGFGQDYETPTEIARNGEEIWGSMMTFDTICADASWIWTNNGMDLYATRYFSTPITTAASVPEPGTLSLVLMAGVIHLRRRK